MKLLYSTLLSTALLGNSAFASAKNFSVDKMVKDKLMEFGVNSELLNSKIFEGVLLVTAGSAIGFSLLESLFSSGNEKGRNEERTDGEDGEDDGPNNGVTTRGLDINIVESDDENESESERERTINLEAARTDKEKKEARWVAISNLVWQKQNYRDLMVKDLKSPQGVAVSWETLRNKYDNAYFAIYDMGFTSATSKEKILKYLKNLSGKIATTHSEKSELQTTAFAKALKFPKEEKKN